MSRATITSLDMLVRRPTDVRCGSPCRHRPALGRWRQRVGSTHCRVAASGSSIPLAAFQLSVSKSGLTQPDPLRSVKLQRLLRPLPDPPRTNAFLRTGQSEKATFRGLKHHFSAVGDLTRSASPAIRRSGRIGDNLVVGDERWNRGPQHRQTAAWALQFGPGTPTASPCD